MDADGVEVGIGLDGGGHVDEGDVLLLGLERADHGGDALVVGGDDLVQGEVRAGELGGGQAAGGQDLGHDDLGRGGDLAVDVLEQILEGLSHLVRGAPVTGVVGANVQEDQVGLGALQPAAVLDAEVQVGDGPGGVAFVGQALPGGDRADIAHFQAAREEPVFQEGAVAAQVGQVFAGGPLAGGQPVAPGGGHEDEVGHAVLGGVAQALGDRVAQGHDAQGRVDAQARGMCGGGTSRQQHQKEGQEGQGGLFQD